MNPSASPVSMNVPAHALPIAVVVPCYKVQDHLVDLLRRFGPEVWRIYLVDDCCPVGSVQAALAQVDEPRVRALKTPVNLGVGGAVMLGVSQALADGAGIIVKIDGDGQMPPELVPLFVAPIAEGKADCTKGNRFYTPEFLQGMPAVRIVGNALLSFVGKLSTGYWDLFDINNGYIAAHAKIWRRLPAHKISPRFFFESDLLFRMNIVRAVVWNIPMKAVYGQEKSNLRIRAIVGEFAGKHIRNFFKRIAYCYFIRDMSAASIALLAGTCLLLFAAVFGGWHWLASAQRQTYTPTGTIMITALAAIMGFQFLVTFLNADIANVPREPIHPRLQD